MSSRDVRGLIGVGAIRVEVSRRILSHRPLRRLTAVEVSGPESNSDGSGDGPLGRTCASASLLIKSSTGCNLSTSSVLSLVEERVGKAHLRCDLSTAGLPTPSRRGCDPDNSTRTN
jgi:hypothetical protein